MSTRSMISFHQPNGRFRAVYCHSDGYLSWNGHMLASFYHSAGLAARLTEMGDLSCLNPKIGVKHDFDWRMNLRERRDFKKEWEGLTDEERNTYLGRDGSPNQYVYQCAEIDKLPEASMCSFYERDRGVPKDQRIFGDSPYHTEQALLDAYYDSMCQYLYVWSGCTWWLYDEPEDHSLRKFIPLVPAVKADPAWIQDRLPQADLTPGPTCYLPRKAYRECRIPSVHGNSPDVSPEPQIITGSRPIRL